MLGSHPFKNVDLNLSAKNASKAVLRLKVEGRGCDYSNVWAIGQDFKSSASVSVIEYNDKKYLITNAHATNNATMMCIKQSDENSMEYTVDVVWEDKKLDLAILVPARGSDGVLNKKTQQFIDALPAIKLSAKLFSGSSNTPVKAYGYPGNDTLSVVAGHISKTLMGINSFSGLVCLMGQMTAPTNPGNSGGPVTTMINQEEYCVGVSSSGALASSGLNNVTFFIPGSSVAQVIGNYEKYKNLYSKKLISCVTVPRMSFEGQEFSNEIFRQEVLGSDLGLGIGIKDNQGLYVTKVPENSCAKNKLMVGDVILSIDGYDIYYDGCVRLPELGNIGFNYVIQKRQWKDEVIVQVARRNENNILQRIDLGIMLTEQIGNSLLGVMAARPTPYYIQPTGKKGGITFLAANSSYLRSYTPVPLGYAGGLMKLELSENLRQAVIYHSSFPSDETKGYNNLDARSGAASIGDRVTYIDGKIIKCMQDVVDIFEETFDKPNPKPVKVELANGKMMYVAPPAKEAAEYLQSTYRVAYMHSSGLWTNPKRAEKIKKVMHELTEKPPILRNVIKP